METDTKKFCQKVANQGRINTRLTAVEEVALERDMRKGGWTNVTGYVKSRLFPYLKSDWGGRQHLDSVLEGASTEDCAVALRTVMLRLANCYALYCCRYNEDMKLLQAKGDADVERFIRATKRWHVKALDRCDETFALVSEIAKALGMKAYFKMPSDSMTVKSADQIRLERTILGRGRVKLVK